MRLAFVFLGISLLGCGDDSSSTDSGAKDATTFDAPADAPADVSFDAPGDASSNDAAADAGEAGTSAYSTCTGAIAPTGSTIYSGTTCDGQDQTSLSCNSGAHREVWVRIDGDAGQIWKVAASPGLAMGIYDSFSQNKCGTTENVCLATYGADGGVPADAGVSASDGPFPSARTDYFVFESENPTSCGPYTITVTAQ